MKKYFPGLFAIVLAVSLSAFTAAKQPSASKTLSPLFWYVVDQGTNSILEGTEPVHDEKSNMGNPCGSGTGADCLRGFEVEQTLPTSDRGDDQIEYEP